MGMTRNWRLGIIRGNRKLVSSYPADTTGSGKLSYFPKIRVTVV